MTITYENLLAFLYREARLLDDKQWEEWLQLYAPDAEFWMPAWDDDGTLVTDPQREVSLIWYGNRAVWRTGCSASRPSGPAPPACRSRAPRTTSATSRSWSSRTASASCASTGSR